MRLIDADELMKHAGNCYDEQGHLLYAVGTGNIMAAKTIDPVKHGKWLLHEYPDGYYHTECSECGKVYDEMVYFLKKAHYCPNCGSKNGGEG